MKSLNHYTFEEQLNRGAKGVQEITNFLNSLPETQGSIENVENDPDFQEKDIDLLWSYIKNNQDYEVSIEVKTDSYDSPNFFFETLSNVSKGTPGCFIYSEATYLFYYYIEKETLYVLPLEETREWFLENKNDFKSIRTGTSDDESKAELYQTEGKLVPISRVLEEVEKVTVLKKSNGTFKRMFS